MKTQEILALLNEASTCTDAYRLAKIQSTLGKETAAFNRATDMYEIDNRAAGIHATMDALFIRLWRTSPHLLPQMLPFFELVCGDRDETSIFSKSTK